MEPDCLRHDFNLVSEPRTDAADDVLFFFRDLDFKALLLLTADDPATEGTCVLTLDWLSRESQVFRYPIGASGVSDLGLKGELDLDLIIDWMDSLAPGFSSGHDRS